MSVNEKMTAIADNIRDKTGGTDKLTLDGMADSIDEVYAAGEKSEYDRFWDNYQSKYVNYNYAFYSSRWNDENFKPKYDITPVEPSNVMSQMFGYCSITNLTAILKKCGVKLDTSNYQGTNAAAWFIGAQRLTHVPEINIAKAPSGLGQCFQNCKSLQEIEKLVFSDSGTQSIDANAFYECSVLTDITFGGVIGDSIDLHWSPLSKDSILSLFDVLSPDASGKTVSLSLGAVNNVFETETGLADGSTSEEWLSLIADKSNWTISLT